MVHAYVLVVRRAHGISGWDAMPRRPLREDLPNYGKTELRIRSDQLRTRTKKIAETTSDRIKWMLIAFLSLGHVIKLIMISLGVDSL